MAVDAARIPNITEFILRASPVSQATIARLASLMERKTFPRRHILIREGFADGKVWFVENGATRSYWLVDGREVTTSFSVAGCVVFSMDEVYYSLPSKEYVESIVAIEAFSVGVGQLMQLVSTDIELANWWRVIHQNEYRRLHRSHKERLTLGASERYEAFRSQFPQICACARLADIASYLGLTPATLSRIRGGK